MSPIREITVLHPDRSVVVPAVAHETSTGGTLLVDPSDLVRAIGWELKPEGLCRDDVCVPVRDRTTVSVDGRVDLRAVADALRAPFALHAAEGVASLADPAPDRAEAMASLTADDVTLPDLDGRPVSLLGLGHKKKTLLAWSSW